MTDAELCLTETGQQIIDRREKPGLSQEALAVTTLGLGRTMEKKLHAVGIHSAEELKRIGSEQATARLKALYPNTCVVILYHLEAAIQGVEIKQLDARRKEELKAYFRQISGE